MDVNLTIALPTQQEVFGWLQEVKDPEIPVISIVELGIVEAVEISSSGHVQVKLIPTFAGCPAVQFMRLEVEACLRAHGVSSVAVELLYNKPWNSGRVTALGRQLLKQFGLSPPPALVGELSLEQLQHAECPRCDSHDTVLLNPFGPTLCRAVHHCNHCHETFEQFKPL